MGLRSDARAIARAAVASADPHRAVRRVLRVRGREIHVGRSTLRLPPGAELHCVAIGKAAGAMLDAAIRVAGSSTRGIAFAPRGYPSPRSGRPVVFGNHPVPGSASFAAGARIVDYVGKLAEHDVAIFLLSGGGSSTVELPAPGLEANDLVRTTRLLLGSGAPLSAMNAIRRHLSQIKGGRLATSASCGQFAAIAISDVVGDVPSDIASGPTVTDPTTFADALHAAERYGLLRRLPGRVLGHLRAGARRERAAVRDRSWGRVAAAPFVVAASNAMALRAARVEARRRGYRPVVLDRPVVGESAPAAERFVRTLLRVARAPDRGRPVALIGGGETTVRLGPRPRPGGRNCEFVAAALRPLAGTNALVLSLGTDGIDGTTPAAGGWVDGAGLGRAERLGLNVAGALRAHDTYALLRRLGGLVTTGPTGTNVMDVHLGLAGVASTGQSRYGRK